MKWFTYCCWRLRLIAALLLAGLVPLSQAALPSARAASERTECIGYYTVNLPGDLEYALMDNFSQALGAWGSDIRLDLTGLGRQELFISQPVGVGGLTALVEKRNVKQQVARDDLLRQADLFTPQEAMHEKLMSEAQLTQLFVPIQRRNAYGAMLEKDNREKLALHALVNGHILSTELKPQGTPEQTLDAFLSHYKPRALGELPTGPGVCVPFGFFTGEEQPATIGLNIRLKDQPDIVMYLLARDAATDTPEDPEKYIDRKTEPMTMFYASRGAFAMNRLSPYKGITIDGHRGKGAFVNIKRDATLLQKVNNPATDDIDWGYLAYIPGLSGGKPGESFNLTFKVERFGRFAARPMTESEFRALVLRIAASIKRRPEAFRN